MCQEIITKRDGHCFRRTSVELGVEFNENSDIVRVTGDCEKFGKISLHVFLQRTKLFEKEETNYGSFRFNNVGHRRVSGAYKIQAKED